MTNLGRLSIGRWLAVAGSVLMCALLALPIPTGADHESTTTAVFAPVEASTSPNGTGDGLIDFHGGPEPESRWTATFRFSGLAAESPYVVMVQGRFGDDGSAEAAAFTEVCRFTTDANGAGGCWYYFVGLRRLGTMEVRLGDPEGDAVLAATRGDGPGSMARQTNAFSLTLTATPLPATPVASPAG